MANKGKCLYVPEDLHNKLIDLQHKKRYKKPADSVQFLYDLYKQSKAIGRSKNEQQK